ncbi:MAG: glycosyltransferase family 39 protein [Deltaproteobacteria bacterium]|nr:glycosyltransferase family 39 protein [Deltaproteobacteria bacterium]
MSQPSADHSKQRDLGFMLLVAITSLAPRLFVALAWAREPVWDGHYYDFGARRIAAGLGYSDDVIVAGVARWHPWCHYPVGYSGFLAGVYKLFGDGPHAATVANAILGAAVVALTHQIALQMMSKWRARAAAILCALHPALILYSALVMTELLSAFLPMFALWLALRDRDKHPWRGAALSGLAMGLATLVSPQAIVLAPAIGLALVPSAPWKQAWLNVLKRGAVVTAVAFAVVTPWTLRNCKVMDGCAFVSTNGGWNLAIGSFARATGRFETLRASDGCEVVTGQVQQDRCWAQHGWASIRKDPVRWLGLAPKKLDQSFNHESFAVEYLKTGDPAAWPEERRTWWRERLSTFHRLLLSAAAFGFLGVVSRKRMRELLAGDRQRTVMVGMSVEAALWLATIALVAYGWHDDQFPFWPLALWLPIVILVPRPQAPRPGAVGLFIAWAVLSFDIVHVVFFGEDRYHIPLSPLLCILVASIGRSASEGVCPEA